MLIIIAILVIGLGSMIQWDNLPLFSPNHKEISIWSVVTPAVFTSFGFQVIFHTLTNYCNKNAKNDVFIWKLNSWNSIYNLDLWYSYCSTS
ncbi:MAG: aromatic amino acid transport family protein [Rickettsia aeschlimannii]